MEVWKWDNSGTRHTNSRRTCQPLRRTCISLIWLLSGVGICVVVVMWMVRPFAIRFDGSLLGRLWSAKLFCERARAHAWCLEGTIRWRMSRWGGRVCFLKLSVVENEIDKYHDILAHIADSIYTTSFENKLWVTQQSEQNCTNDPSAIPRIAGACCHQKGLTRRRAVEIGSTRCRNNPYTPPQDVEKLSLELSSENNSADRVLILRKEIPMRQH